MDNKADNQALRGTLAHPESEDVSTTDVGLEPTELGYWLSMGSPCCFHQGPRPPLAVPTVRQVTKAEIKAQPSPATKLWQGHQPGPGLSRKQNLVRIVNIAAEL